LSATSTVAPSTVFGDRERGAVRVTLDAVDGTNKTVTFYTSDNIDGTWTMLGTAVTTAGNTSIFNSTAALQVGSSNDGDSDAFVFNFPGKIWKAEVRDSIGGTVVADCDFTAVTPGAATFDDSTGKTWTVQGTADVIIGYERAVSAWNPGGELRNAISALWFTDRMHIWRDDADAQTPIAVTDAIATAARATLHTTVGTTSSVVPTENFNWRRKEAYLEQKKWYDFARTTDANGFKSADGGATVVIPSGESVTLFGDTLKCPAIDEDDTFRDPIGFARNSMIIKNSSGAITDQIYSGADGTPAITPDLTEFPNGFYWPSGGCMDNGSLQWVCALREGGGFGTFIDQQVVTIDTTTFAVTDRISIGEPQIVTENFVPDTDTGFIYIVLLTPLRIGRVAIGSLSVVADWRYWDGSIWNTDIAAAQPIQETIPGGGTQTLVMNSDVHQGWNTRKYDIGWLAVVHSYFDNYVKIYYSTTPQGPYTWYKNVHVPELGGQRWALDIFTYGPHWHPERDVSTTRLMLSINAQPIGAPTYGSEVTDYFYQNMHYVVVDIDRDLF
jgi:hypothetical protein